MKSIVIRNIVAVILATSLGHCFGQVVRRPGQLATAPAVLASGGAPAFTPGFNKSGNGVAFFEERHDRMVNRIWVSSMLAVVGTTALDAASSWGKREANPFLASSDGTFGAKGLSIKAAMTMGVILPEVLLRQHKGLKSKFAIGNFAEATIFGAVAVHNLGIPRTR